MARSPRAISQSPWAVLSLALLFTVSIGGLVLQLARQRDVLRFRSAVQSTQDHIIARLEIYRTALRGTASLFAAREDLTVEEFRRYVRRLDVHTRYPGIQGIGWSARLAVLDTGAVDERHAITYLEPLDARNAAAIGYDMYSEPTRRAAMALARDSGRQAMSGRVILVQEIQGPVQPGFLIYVPVYRGGNIPATTAERRARLMGFAYSPFRGDDLFRGIFGSETRPRVSFTVYDGVRADSSKLLHATARDPSHRPAFTTTRTIVVADRPWTIVYSSEPVFEEGSSAWVWFWVFIVTGFAGSLGLFLFARGQERARMQAEAASSAKSNFLAVMSHELRTPLNAIGGYVDLMQLGIGGAITDQQRGYLDRIHRAQRHLLGLINGVLNYSRLEAGRLPYNIETLPLARLLTDAEALVLPQIVAAGLRFENIGGPPIAVRADAEKLRQILLNLLSNAIKFTPAGGSVSVAWARRNGDAAITVSDTGRGIPAEKLEQIFDPFVQVDSDLTRTTQGTGLGLSIARELARGMNGEIEVSSEVGKGTALTVLIPLAS